MIRRLWDRQERKFFGALFAASPGYATAWWVLLVLRGALPALLAVATGSLIGAVERGDLARRPPHLRRHRVRAIPGAHARCTRR